MLLGKEGEAFFLREAPREESDGERMEDGETILQLSEIAHLICNNLDSLD